GAWASEGTPGRASIDYRTGPIPGAHFTSLLLRVVMRRPTNVRWPMAGVEIPEGFSGIGHPCILGPSHHDPEERTSLRRAVHERVGQRLPDAGDPAQMPHVVGPFGTGEAEDEEPALGEAARLPPAVAPVLRRVVRPAADGADQGVGGLGGAAVP